MLSRFSKDTAQPRRKGPSTDDLVPLAARESDRRVALSPERLGRLIQAFDDDENIKLNFEHDYAERPVGFSKLWFRDACPCSQCVSESSGQKKFSTCDIDANPQLERCRVTGDGKLELVWAKDCLTGNSHTSIYTPEILQQAVLMSGGLHRHWRFTPERVLWDKRRFEHDMGARFISYEDWMAGGDVFAKAFLDLVTWGLIFVRGVPESHDAVQHIASKIGDLQSTFYGLTWDVISKPNAENVAYTNEFLCLHQDLLYWTDTPRLQLLHCLKNECPGGESLFSDGLRIAWELKTTHVEDYKVLVEQGVDFHYHKQGNFYHSRRNVISAKAGHPIKINWSPPFQAPFYQDPNDLGLGNSHRLHRWREAARIFRDQLESPPNMLQYRLQPGECVLFDNQRILHGRTKFDTESGHRHLRGGYIDTQTLSSTFVRLGELGALGALDQRPVDRWDTWE